MKCKHCARLFNPNNEIHYAINMLITYNTSIRIYVFEFIVHIAARSCISFSILYCVWNGKSCTILVFN